MMFVIVYFYNGLSGLFVLIIDWLILLIIINSNWMFLFVTNPFATSKVFTKQMSMWQDGRYFSANLVIEF